MNRIGGRVSKRVKSPRGFPTRLSDSITCFFFFRRHRSRHHGHVTLVGNVNGNAHIAAVAHTVLERKSGHLPSGGTEYRPLVLGWPNQATFTPTPIPGIQSAVVATAGSFLV